MIVSFRSKALEELWATGRSAKIDVRLQQRIKRRLIVMDRSAELSDLKVPGFDFHALHGFDPTRYTIHINGPWCLTFEFEAGKAYRIDLEQYH